MLSALWLILAVPACVTATSLGAPGCDTTGLPDPMGALSYDAGTSPHTFALSQAAEGDPVTVTLTASGSFIGLLLYFTSDSSAVAFGTFAAQTNFKAPDGCARGLTHSGTGPKTSQSFTWNAPAGTASTNLTLHWVIASTSYWTGTTTGTYLNTPAPTNVPGVPTESPTTTPTPAPTNRNALVINGVSVPFQFCAGLTAIGNSNPDGTLCWNIVTGPPQQVDIAYQVRSHTGWIAFGFGNGGTMNQMVGGNVVAGWTDPARTNINVDGWHLQDKTTGAVRDARMNVTSPEVYLDGTDTVTIRFTRDAVVSGVQDVRLSPADALTNVVWAKGGLPSSSASNLAYHTSSGYGSVGFASGAVVQGEQNPTVLAHGALMYLAWGIMLPTGANAARFFRSNPHWWNTHRGCQSFGIILAFIAFILGIAVIGSHTKKAHMGIGIVVTILGVFNPINAIFRPHIEKGVPKTEGRIYWEHLHHWVGRSAILLGFVNLFIGVRLLIPNNTAFLVIIAITVALQAVAFIGLEIMKPRDEAKVN